MEAKHLPVLFASDTRAERQRESADGREGVLGGVAVPSISPSGALSDEDAAVKAAASNRPRRMKRKPILRRATPGHLTFLLFSAASPMSEVSRVDRKFASVFYSDGKTPPAGDELGVLGEASTFFTSPLRCMRASDSPCTRL